MTPSGEGNGKHMKNKSKLIYTSSDYSKFIKDEANRAVRPNPKLKAAMRKYGWLDAFPMLVVLRDGKMVIKDGQHRFDAATELHLPVKYVILDEDGIQASEISVGLSWSLSDFVASYCQRGNKEYQRLASFKNETGLPLAICAGLLFSNSNACGATKAIKSGQFKVRNEGHARAVVSIIHAASNVVKWASNAYFVSAISQAIMYAKIDVGTLCDKIRSHPGKLVLQPTVEDFIAMVETLYNFRNQATIPIAHNIKNALKAQRVESVKANRK